MAFGDAPRIFDLQAVVNILTSKAETQLSDFEKKAQGSGSSIEKGFLGAQAQVLKLAGPAVLGALGAVLTAVATQTVKLGQEMHDAMARFRAETGASVKEAEQFSRTLGNVWRTSSADINSITGTLISLKKTFGDLGGNTEDVARQFESFAKITGVDTSEAIKDMGGHLRQLGLDADQAPAALDRLVKAQQLTGVNAGQLLEDMNAASGAIAGLGFTSEEAIAHLSAFAKVSDGSNFQDVFGQLAQVAQQGGDSAADAFKKLGIAVDESGRPVASLREVFDSLVKTLAEGKGKSADFQAALGTILGEQGVKDFQAAFGGTGDAITKMAKKLENSIGTVESAAKSFESLGDKLQYLWKDAFGETIQGGAGAFAGAMGSMIDAAQWVVDAIQDMGTVAGHTFYQISLSAGTAAEGIIDVFQGVENIIKDMFIGIYEGIADLVNTIPDDLKGPLADVEKYARARANLIESLKSDKEATITGGLSKIGGTVTDWFSGTTLGLAGAGANKEIENRQKEADAAKKASAERTALAEKERKAKEAQSKADADAAEAKRKRDDQAIKDAQKVKDAVTAQADALKHEIDVGKVSGQEAMKRYESIIAGAKKAGLEQKDIYALEKDLYSLRKDGEEKLKEAHEKRLELEKKMKVEWLTAVKGESAGLLEALEQERAKRQAAGVDAVALESWVAAEKRKIFDADAKRKDEQAKKDAEAVEKRHTAENALSDSRAKLEQQALESQGKRLEAVKAGLDQELAETVRGLDEQLKAIKDEGGDMLKAKHDYQLAVEAAQKDHNLKVLQAEKDAARDRLKVEQDLQSDILRAKAKAETDPAKAAALNRQADNATTLQEVRDTYAAAKAQGVDDSVLREYLKAKQKEALAGDRGTSSGSSENQAEQAGGFSLPTFSFDSGGGRSPREARQLAKDIGAIGLESSTDVPAQDRQAILKKAGYDVAAPLTPEEQRAQTDAINAGDGVGLLGRMQSFAKGLNVGGLDPASRSAAAKLANNSVFDRMASASSKAKELNNEFEVGITVNVKHDGKTVATGSASSSTSNSLDMASTYTPGRLT